MNCKFILIFLVAVVCICSCTDLDPEDSDVVTEEVFFENGDAYISYIGKIYPHLQSLNSFGNYYLIQEVSSDEVVVPQRGRDGFDGGVWIKIHQHDFNMDLPSIYDLWNSCYRGILECNKILQYINGKEFPRKWEAEVRVMRAYWYYILLDVFGNIPIVLEHDIGPGFIPTTSERSSVFTFVEEELRSNVEFLSRDNDLRTYGRINYYTGQAILSALYLNAREYTGQEYYDECIITCDKIIFSEKYVLEPNYFNNFTIDNAGSKEIIWAIPYDDQVAHGFHLVFSTLHPAHQSTFQLREPPWNMLSVMEDFFHSFESNDRRLEGDGRGYGVMLYGLQYDEAGNILMDDSEHWYEDNAYDGIPRAVFLSPEIRELFPRAGRDDGARISKYEIQKNISYNMNNDFIVYRYAEILLNKAEALWRLNPNDPNALELVNLIRERAGVEPFIEITTDNLLAERGRELCFEGKRRTDLIRFDAWSESWWEKNYSEDYKKIMPIPFSYLTGGTNIKQNPGY